MKINRIIWLAGLLSLLLTACTNLKYESLPHLSRPNPLRWMHPDCKDPLEQYKPITYLKSKRSYNAEPQSYRPIKNSFGVILIDYNGDTFIDMFFLEREGKDIRLINCETSKGKGEKVKRIRNITSFKIHETITADFQTISESILFKDSVLSLTTSKHEHNWGSDTETSLYVYSPKYGDFILQQKEIVSSSGDGLRSDTYELYDLKHLRYKKSSTCGSLEEGCKPQKSSGRIVLVKNHPTLTKLGKIYHKLIAD